MTNEQIANDIVDKVTLGDSKNMLRAIAKKYPTVIIEFYKSDNTDLSPFELDIVELIRKRNKIGAVRKYREVFGEGLKESKYAVEAIYDRYLKGT